MKEIIVTEETRKALVSIVNKIKVSPVMTYPEKFRINNAFDFGNMTTEQLRDTRNQVVKACSNVKRGLRAEGKWGQFDRMDCLMSKVVTVIDEHLFNEGAL